MRQSQYVIKARKTYPLFELCNEGLDFVCKVIQIEGESLLFASADLDLALSFLEASVSKCDSDWDSDEIGICELHTCALLAVIVKNLDSCCLEIIVDLLCNIRVLDQADEVDLVRGNCNRKLQTVLVIVLFAKAGKKAPDSDSVASHDDRLSLAVLVLVIASHGLGVACSELEDVSDLNAL